MKIIRHKYILLFVITNTIAYIRTAKDKKTMGLHNRHNK